jgi:hypothetical protein
MDRDVPWGWLLLGLGGGAISALLAQRRRRQDRTHSPQVDLGMRIVALPDPGRQSLQPAENAPLPPLPDQLE